MGSALQGPAEGGQDLSAVESGQPAGVSRLHSAPRWGALRPWGVLFAAVVLGLAVALATYDRPQRVAPDSVTEQVPASGEVAGEVGVVPPQTQEQGNATASVTPSGAVGAVVHVVGAVHQPGVLTMPVGARVGDAVEAAGGALPGADLSGLNLARRINDGEQIVVGVPASEVAAQVGAVPAPSTAAGSTLINLNQADSGALQDLPRVGPATAEKILRYRQDNGPFTSVDQLLEVPGIGEATLAGLRDLVTV